MTQIGYSRSNIPFNAREPVYRTTGSKTVTYPNKNKPDTMDRVVLSNLFSRKAGVVVNPLAKYRGRKISAVAIIANAARASQATPTRTLSPNTSPFKPTSCSVERLVKSKDPATTGQLSARPPVKYSSVALSERFMRWTI